MSPSIAFWLLAGVAAIAQDARTPPLGPITITSPDRTLVATVAGNGQLGGGDVAVSAGAGDRQPEGRDPRMVAARADSQRRAVFDTLRLKSVSPARTITERYTLPHGKQRDVSNESSQRTIHFESPGGKPLDLVVRVADDGLAFRYAFPDRSTASHRITEELSGFTVANGSRGWLLPHQQAGQWAPAYEDLFSEVAAGATAPNAAGWSYPALFRLPDSRHWILITEAGLDPGYCGTRLGAEAPGGTYRVRFPDAEEGLGTGAVEPSSTLPWTLPWRVVIVGDGLAPVVESTLVTDVSAPTALTDLLDSARARLVRVVERR